MIQKIVDYLDRLFPEAKCELEFNTDYELVIAVMLSAQTTDKRVNKATAKLFTKYSTISALASAKEEDIMEIIRPLGTQHVKAANILAIAQALDHDYDGHVPNNRAYLEGLKGIGRKSANVILAILYNENCLAVDTHVKRVSIRLGLVTKADNVLTIEEKLTKKFQEYSLRDLHHRLVLFGRYYCTARQPKCDICELKAYCKAYKIRK